MVHTAEGIISAMLAFGPQKYGLQMDIDVLRDIVADVRSEKYINDIKNNIKNLSAKMLESILDVLDKMLNEQFDHP